MDKYIVCTTKKQWETVLKKFEEDGYKWVVGNSVLSGLRYFDAYKSESVLHVHTDTKKLAFAKKDFYRGCGIKVFISAHDFLKGAKTKPIVIYRNGRVVTAEDKNIGEKGVATCSPSDEFDFKIGAKIALARLWGEEVPKSLLNDDEIREGDIVRITDTGKQYTTYNEWIKRNITDIDLICQFDYNRDASIDSKYVVVKIAEHGMHNKTLAYVKEKTDLWPRCYLIDVKGLEKVTK